MIGVFPVVFITMKRKRAPKFLCDWQALVE